MVDVQKLLEGVEYNPDFDSRQIAWHDELEFMHIPDQALASEGEMRFVGYAAPYLPAGAFPMPDMSDEVLPITLFAGLPRSLQTVNHLSKGVGTRVYNTQEAARGGSDLRTRYLGLFALDIPTARLLDRRSTQGGTARQIGRHFFQRAMGRALGTEFVANRVHRSYGANDAVLMRIPPRGQHDQRRLGLQNPEGVTDQFLLMRNSCIIMRRIGHIPLEKP